MWILINPEDKITVGLNDPSKFKKVDIRIDIFLQLRY